MAKEKVVKEKVVKEKVVKVKKVTLKEKAENLRQDLSLTSLLDLLIEVIDKVE